MKKLFYILTLFLLCDCRESDKNYTANAEIVRIEKVRFDEYGDPLVIDVELSYFQCPGTQLEIIRGGREFAKCIMQSHKVGDRLRVGVHWGWDSFGYYKWKVQKVDDCVREIDPLDEVSYDLVEECEDYRVYGAKVGFACKRIPTKELIEKCPWFRKK